jgi:hypothetical protein
MVYISICGHVLLGHTVQTFKYFVNRPFVGRDGNGLDSHGIGSGYHILPHFRACLVALVGSFIKLKNRFSNQMPLRPSALPVKSRFSRWEKRRVRKGAENCSLHRLLLTQAGRNRAMGRFAPLPTPPEPTRREEWPAWGEVMAPVKCRHGC